VTVDHSSLASKCQSEQLTAAAAARENGKHCGIVTVNTCDETVAPNLILGSCGEAFTLYLSHTFTQKANNLITITII
jgi:hypothetical protein